MRSKAVAPSPRPIDLPVDQDRVPQRFATLAPRIGQVPRPTSSSKAGHRDPQARNLVSQYKGFRPTALSRWLIREECESIIEPHTSRATLSHGSGEDRSRKSQRPQLGGSWCFLAAGIQPDRLARHPITDTHSFIRQGGDKSGCLASSSFRT